MLPLLELLGLDDRPVNLLWVLLLAALAGMPLGTLAPSEIPEGPALVSLNALVAGGLVESREADPALLPIPVLDGSGLYCFVVPRIEPHAESAEEIQRNADLRQLLRDEGVQMQCIAALQGREALPGSVDPIVRTYVQRAAGWRDWLAACDLPPERLLVAFDDNRPGPLTSFLREWYAPLSEHLGDGADETGMLLFARWLREQDTSGEPLVVGVAATAPESLNRIGRYESRSLRAVLEAQAAWIGVELDFEGPYLPGVPVLLVHPWITQQGDRFLASSPDPNPIPPVLAPVLSGLGGHPVGVADVAWANSGDPKFAPELFAAWQAGEVDLRAYAGWNTAANSLGHALAWLVTDFLSFDDSAAETLREELLRARFIEDVSYLGAVRLTMEHELEANGRDPRNLSEEDLAEVERRMAGLLWQRAKDDGFLNGSSGWSASFPWDRTNEIRLTGPLMSQVTPEP